jgi:hypothetical protein
MLGRTAMVGLRWVMADEKRLGWIHGARGNGCLRLGYRGERLWPAPWTWREVSMLATSGKYPFDDHGYLPFGLQFTMNDESTSRRLALLLPSPRSG